LGDEIPCNLNPVQKYSLDKLIQILADNTESSFITGQSLIVDGGVMD